MGRPLLAVTALVAGLALVAAGCGDGGGEAETTSVSPTLEWAEGFCAAITTWTDGLKEIGDRFTDPSTFSRDGLETAASDVRTATEELVDDLRALGAPETESGDEVKDSIDALATTLDDELAEIDDTVQGVSGLTAIPGAITSITASFAAMSTAFSSTLQALESADVEGELRSALEDSPACADIPG